MLGSVGEFGTRWFFSKCPQRGLMRYEPECYQNFEVLHLGDFLTQEGEALPHFFRRWFILGGNTADGICDSSSFSQDRCFLMFSALPSVQGIIISL